MTGNRRFGRRRIIVVATAAVCLSVVSAGTWAVPAFAETLAAKTARATPLVKGTPCTITAKACVDLESSRAWLFENGRVFTGPVDISSGGKGKETPTGHSLRVYRKELDHKSGESRQADGSPSDMPWSVFFEDGGIAFHGGDPERASAGCIHLEPSDAKIWYEHLQVGDQVQVVKASEEYAARGDDRDSDDLR